MVQLGQRVGLVHELRKLRAAEELAHGRHHRADVDQRAGRRALRVLDGHALLDHALHAQQAHAELRLDQLAHRAHAAVAQVVDVVGAASCVSPCCSARSCAPRSAPGPLWSGRAWSMRHIEAQALVQLVAAHLRQVVAARVEQQRVEQALGVVLRRRVAGAQPLYSSMIASSWVVRAVLVDRRPHIIVVGVGVHILEQRFEYLLIAARSRWRAAGSSPGSCACGPP